MKDHELENLICSLKPGPLPDDLKTRLAPEPMRLKQQPRGWQIFSIAAAAVIVVGFISAKFLMKPGSSVGTEIASIEPEAPVSVLKKNSTLLNSRTLAIKEVDGQLWEVSEEKWLDHTLALCSVGPTELSSQVIRREVVCSPLKFQ